MTFSVSIDLEPIRKQLNNLERKQIPFATSQALNDVAYGAVQEVKRQAPTKLDRPTPYTLKGFRYRKSTKRDLVSSVFIDSNRYKYLRYQIEGGTRNNSGKGTAVPVNIKLNKYGNIPGRRKGIIKKKSQFIGNVRGKPAIWERSKKGLKLLAVIKTHVTYKKRLPFNNIVRQYVERTFRSKFDVRIKNALI